MAAAMLEAIVAVLLLVAKVPTVELLQPFVPAELPPIAPHVKAEVALDTERKLPIVVSVIGIPLPTTVPAVTPTFALPVSHALIAVLMFAATSAVVVLVTKVPALAPVQVWVPLKPEVAVFQTKLLVASESVKVGFTPSVVW